jgi:uncharacterized radical SAM superfamily Fe-S cluster-containing enzyme
MITETEHKKIHQLVNDFGGERKLELRKKLIDIVKRKENQTIREIEVLTNVLKKSIEKLNIKEL